MDASKIIIIHPGSQFLRIGRASDLNPVTILHAVAYKRRNVDRDWPYHDQMLPPIDNINPMQLQVEFEEQRLAVSHILQSSIVDQYNRRRVATPPQQLAIYNRNSPPTKISPPEGVEEHPWVNTHATHLFDKHILRLNAFDIRDYDIHFPIRRGEFNLHKGKGGSLTAVMSHLECIWTYALEQRLGIPKDTLSKYKAVFIINDIFKRSNLREYGTLLLQRLGFSSMFMVQDHVAATYGAGVGHACVVDIGDQKCSISCVEDGISLLDTRVRLGYGGGDVTQVLLMMFRKCAFPYRECNVQDSYVDAKIVTILKERFCHLRAEVCGAQEKIFNVRKHNGQWLRFTLQVGDECLMAPMALFNTELLNITSQTRNVLTQAAYRHQTDPEDCFDADYLRETNRRNGRDTFNDGISLSMPITGDMCDDEINVVDVDFINDRETVVPPNSKERETQIYYTNGQVASLDVAIIRSIDRCSSIEIKKKMFGCIVLVGGCVKIPGIANWLEGKLSRQLKGIEVNAFLREMDPRIISWKGAAIMSILESARELYITKTEWERCGLRVLREKAPFIW